MERQVAYVPRVCVPAGVSVYITPALEKHEREKGADLWALIAAAGGKALARAEDVATAHAAGTASGSEAAPAGASGAQLPGPAPNARASRGRSGTQRGVQHLLLLGVKEDSKSRQLAEVLPAGLPVFEREALLAGVLQQRRVDVEEGLGFLFRLGG